jgi:hypothetical protein
MIGRKKPETPTHIHPEIGWNLLAAIVLFEIVSLPGIRGIYPKGGTHLPSEIFPIGGTHLWRGISLIGESCLEVGNILREGKCCMSVEILHRCTVIVWMTD